MAEPGSGGLLKSQTLGYCTLRLLAAPVPDQPWPWTLRALSSLLASSLPMLGRQKEGFDLLPNPNPNCLVYARKKGCR